MKSEVIITGCSSFNEKYWQGIFYPANLPRKDWFAYYCKHFDTYEMNGTFYRFPTGKSMAQWYAKAPDGFRFSVKMYKGVTHFKKFADCQTEIADFYTVCSNNLQEKLACVLFQLPPSFSFSADRLHLILDSLDHSFTNVVEFRHSSWWNDEVYTALRKAGVVFCNVSYPGLPEELHATAPTAYVRLHGVPKLFYSGYDKQALESLRSGLLKLDCKEAFVYFNNTAGEEGILNALTLRHFH